MTPNNQDQFSPIKWEEFESVGRPYAPLTLRIFSILCAMVVIGGALFGVCH